MDNILNKKFPLKLDHLKSLLELTVTNNSILKPPMNQLHLS